jgi:UDP-glucose 6-dehydrogenase
MKVAIIGYGPVGQATKLLLSGCGVTCEIQDPARDPSLVIHDWSDIKLAFICVPTNGGPSGKLDLSLLHTAVDSVKDYAHCVIRSTIGPDQLVEFSDCSVMPEFIRERHYVEDIESKMTPCIIGTTNEKLFDLILDALKQRHYNPVVTSPREAMMTKMAINSFLATKVAFANDVWMICSKLGMRYDLIKELVQLDPRVGKTHWDVPGPDGDFGFGGKCFPKDTNHFASLAPDTPLLDTITKYAAV